MPILLGIFCFLVFSANLRSARATQLGSVPPLILWHSKTFGLDADARLVAHGHSLIADQNRPANVEGKVTYFEPSAYWMFRTREHQLASMYPVVTPLLVLHAIGPQSSGSTEQPEVDRVEGKITALLLASIATVLMFLALHRDSCKWASRWLWHSPSELIPG
jgi:hypothetical protein